MKLHFNHSIFVSVILLLTTCLTAQNIGINIINPTRPLSFPAITGKKISLYPGATGDAGFGVFANELRIHSDHSGADVTFGYDTYPSTFTERMRIKGNGNVGIGTSSPEYLLDINGRARLRQVGGNTAGLWYNKSDNTEYIFAGMRSDTVWGLYESGYKFNFDMKNTRLGIGTILPQYPLVFAHTLGDKISLYGGAGAPNADHYGFGIQGSLMQLFTPASTADIAFGYGRSAAFTEKMRIKGDGTVGIGTSTPSTKLQIIGGSDAGLASNGYIQLGPTNGGNLVIDNNEIVARNNGLESDMWIQQDDGNLMLCGLGLGSVGVGVAASADLATGYLFSVKGKIIAEEVRVQLYAAWPDYVFHPDYSLMPLDHLEKYIGENHHLPGFLKAATIDAEGADVGETQRRLLEKVEELTLYVIELKKEIDQLKKK